MVAAFPLRAAMGFSRGFDYFGDQLEAPPGGFVITNLHTVGVASRPGERIAEEFGLWLAANRGPDPFFAWLHFYDPHWPWQAGAGYAELYADEPYNGEVAYMDDCIGRGLKTLDEAGLSRTTGLVVVADHGEGLEDHGELTHGLLLYNPTIRVPLIVSLPWLENQQQRVETFVSNADVMPTVLEALGIEPEDLEQPVQARSLMPLVTPSADTASSADPSWDRSLYFETFYPYLHYRWSPLSGFVNAGRKYIHGPQDELYDLLTDLGEERPLGGLEEFVDLEERLARLEADLRRGRPETRRHLQSREELARLQALGYVGSTPVDDPEDIHELSLYPHPKDAMPTFFKYNDILAYIQEKRLAEAVDLAQSIAEEDPNQKDARLTVATLSVALGRYQAAEKAFTELVEDFTDKDVVYKAGLYFQSRDDNERARQCFEQLVKDDPSDTEVLTRLAEMAISEEKLDEARRLLEATLDIDPFYREAMLGLAVLLDRQSIDEAEEKFAAVATRYPFDPRVNFDYGVYLLRHGRDVEAVERLRLATTFSSGPLFAASQFALAAFYERQGELDQARACLRKVVVQTDNPIALRRAQAKLAALGDR